MMNVAEVAKKILGRVSARYHELRAKGNENPDLWSVILLEEVKGEGFRTSGEISEMRKAVGLAGKKSPAQRRFRFASSRRA